MSHLAEMQQRAAEKASLDRQALAAKAEFTKLADAAKALQQKADQDEEERWAKERPTAASNVASMVEFIASGRLVRKVPIDSRSIDPREFSLLSPDDTTAGSRLRSSFAADRLEISHLAGRRFFRSPAIVV